MIETIRHGRQPQSEERGATAFGWGIPETEAASGRSQDSLS